MRTHNSYCARSEYHTQLAKMSFDEIFDLTAGVYFHFYNIFVFYYLETFFVVFSFSPSRPFPLKGGPRQPSLGTACASAFPRRGEDECSTMERLSLFVCLLVFPEALHLETLRPLLLRATDMEGNKPPTVQYSTVQYSTAQHSTAQHSTA